MKTDLPTGEKSAYVRGVFTRIAPRYDLMNRLMTAGQDVTWRREVIRRAELPPGGRLLDLGAGTGDLAREALRQYPAAQVVAADFTLAMMITGARGRVAKLSAADAQLPSRESRRRGIGSSPQCDRRFAALAEMRRVSPRRAHGGAGHHLPDGKFLQPLRALSHAPVIPLGAVVTAT